VRNQISAINKKQKSRSHSHTKRGLPEVLPAMSRPIKQVNMCRQAVLEGDSVKFYTYPFTQ
jgi:hypothetical protein